MTVEEIRELIRLALETGVAELEVQRGDNRVRIRRAVSASQEIVLPPPSAPPSSPPPPVPAVAGAPSAAPHPVVEAPTERSDKAVDPNVILVKSPIVGTFYDGPSPGATPFVRVGERVQPGKVLCIIESMKLMNEIEAEVDGFIESKLVLNGQPVEYGEALFAIRPV